MRGLAEIAERFGSGTIRLTVWQNLLISDVADRDVGICIAAIDALGLGIEASAIRRGLVACTGNAGCKFAASNTKGHALRLADYLEARVALDLPINIHLTGCHHSCAQHYIGDIGLLAAKVERGEDSVEGYHVYIGGGAASTAEQAMAREYRDVGGLRRPAAADRAPARAPGSPIARRRPNPSSSSARRHEVAALRDLAGRRCGARGMNAITPIPSIIPENAPFSSEQRAWLNGFFAAYLGVSGEAAGQADAAADPDEDFPWHDAVAGDGRAAGACQGPQAAAPAHGRHGPARLRPVRLSLPDLCRGRVVGRRGRHGPLRAGRQGDPAQAEGAFGRAGTAARRSAWPLRRRKPAAPVGSRDRPALATLVDAHPLNRPGSGKDVRHVVLDLSATDLTYEAGDSLGVFARKNPQLVQAVLDRVGATGEEMVAFDGEALPLRQVLLSKVDIARPSDDCLLFLASRAFDGEEVLKLQALAQRRGAA